MTQPSKNTRPQFIAISYDGDVAGIVNSKEELDEWIKNEIDGSLDEDRLDGYTFFTVGNELEVSISVAIDIKDKSE